MTASQKINAKVSKLSVAALQDMARKLFSDTREGSEIVLGAVLNALEGKMPETAFVAFCDSI